MKSITIILIVLIASPLFAQIKYVPTDYRYIQDAINESKDGDTIIMEDGKYYEHISFKGKAIIVASRYYLDNDRAHITNTILTTGFNTQDSSSLVYFINCEDTTSILSGITLFEGKGTKIQYEDGYSEKVGGAVFIHNSGAKIIDNIFKNNEAVARDILNYQQFAFGGAIECLSIPEDRSVVISGNEFKNNLTKGYRSTGGAVDVAFANGNVTIVQNRFYDNNVLAKESGYGGGICFFFANNNAKLLIENNYIVNNTTYSANGFSKGAGIACYFSAPIIRNNIIVYNSTNYPQSTAKAAFGGGIAVFWYSSWKEVMPNCDPYKLVVVIENNTIAYNNDKVAGGGVALRSVGARLKNNIIGGNFAKQDAQIKIEYPDAPETESRTVIVEYSDIEGGYEGEGNINDFPDFTDEEKWYLNKDYSPCIDAGIPEKKYNDVENPEVSGQARFPALGKLRNDIGAFGGPHSTWTDDFATDIKNIELTIPVSPNLSQNYPNPFNPSTTIKYQIPQINVGTENFPSVQLMIYDILGSQIATLVNEKQKAGNYEINWNGENYPSGIYFYELFTTDYTLVRKMILIK